MALIQWPRQHPVLTTVVLALVSIIIVVPLFLIVHWYWPSVPAIAAEEVETIEVHLLPVPDHQEELRVTTNDPAKVADLLAVLKTSEQAINHKCGKIGTITIRNIDGSVHELRILPGHNREYYEYRYGSRINRVDRVRFLNALQAIGVKQIMQ